jgi:hypothetical protein
MRCIRAVTVLALIAIGGTNLSAQSTPRNPNPVRDSLRAVRKDMKADVAARKAAKVAGDTAKAKAASRDIRKDRKTAEGLKSRLPRKKAAPPKP